MTHTQKIYNALWTQAIADAVGNPFEFRENIDPKRVVDYYHSDISGLTISDDTQMAMFGFEAMHNLLESGLPLTVNRLREYFTKSYLDWYFTQTSNDIFFVPGEHSGLLNFLSMYSIQAPGNTRIASLYHIKRGETCINDSKGCGSVMRLLPLLLLRAQSRPRHDVIGYAQLTGEITHHHPENADAISLYMRFAMDLLGLGYSEIEYSHIKNKKWEDIPEISDIGTGWTALEAVEMAIWAYLKAETFEDLLSLSIAHDGDSDSVAAIAGSLWGLADRPWDKKAIRRLDAADALLHLTLLRQD